MKKLFLLLALTFVFSNSAYANQEYMQNQMYEDIPDYLGQNIIPLSDKERKALNLSQKWAGRGIEPFMVANGKLVYTHGESLVTVLASPMQICDIELQAGESVNEIIIGDSARWFIEKGQAGNVTHLFVKPIDAGLETSAIVTTDRRVYHLKLISSRTDFTPYIGFIYNDDLFKYSSQKNAEKERQALFDSTVIDGQSVDLSNLNFNYSLKGNHSWKPERVYDDNLKTYIKFTQAGNFEMPILLAKKNDQNALINYRIRNNTMIADGIFEEMVLVIGVGNNKEEIRIVRD